MYKRIAVIQDQNSTFVIRLYFTSTISYKEAPFTQQWLSWGFFENHKDKLNREKCNKIDTKYRRNIKSVEKLRFKFEKMVFLFMLKLRILNSFIKR